MSRVETTKPTNVQVSRAQSEIVQDHAEWLNAEYELSMSVARARRDGLTWQQIGNALSMTRQAAHQRWGTHEPAECCEEGARAGHTVGKYVS